MALKDCEMAIAILQFCRPAILQFLYA